MSYPEYVSQRNIILKKNENGFASKKRSQGANAKNYNEGMFNLSYPIFKTPEINLEALNSTIESKLNNDPTASDYLYAIVCEPFIRILGMSFENYKYEFDFLKELFENYANFPTERNDLLGKILYEVKRLVYKFADANRNEILLNTKLNEIRADMYKNIISPLRQEDTPPYPVSRPFYEVKSIYEKSPLWKIFKNMPKIGMLHMHTSATVSPEWIINTLVNDADMNYGKYGESYIILGDDPKKRGTLTFTKPENEPYAVLNRNLLYAENDGKIGHELLDLLSFGSNRINDIGYIWDEFNNIFARTGDLLDNDNFYLDYYAEAFKNLVDDNIEYLELRSGFSKFKNKDETLFLDLLIRAEQTANNYAKGKGKKFKLRVILCGNRGKERRFSVIQKMIKAAKWANDSRFSDLIIGFDAVAEEDRGISTKYYAEFIITSKIYIFLNFYFHDGETSWDFNTNMVDAYLLANRRIGHGFGLNAYPQLTDELAFNENTPVHKPLRICDVGDYCNALEDEANEINNRSGMTDNQKYAMLINKILQHASQYEPILNSLESDNIPRNIALEICPISNQLLRYTPDLRMHPANALLHKGIQGVLANDDPQIFGNIGLTYDFISAFLAWDLDLWQIKQLIVNSIVYSAIPRNPNTKEAYDDIIRALNRFNVLWHKFLIDTVDSPDFFEDTGHYTSGYNRMRPDSGYILDENAVSVNEEYINYVEAN